MYTVYIHTNKTTNKCYVGATKQTIKNRWKNGYGYETQTRFWEDIKKYGWDNFEHIVFAENLSFEQAEQMERMLIALYKTTDPKYGYNVFSCRTAIGVKPDEESRQKMSASHKGKKIPEEQIRKRAEAIRGKNHWLYGKHWDEKTKAKMRAAKLGKKQSPEHIKKCSIARQKPIVCVENGKLYSSYKEAAADLNICRSNISDVVRGVKKSAGGYHFVRPDDCFAILASHDGSRCFVDRDFPHTEIIIEEYNDE